MAVILNKTGNDHPDEVNVSLDDFEQRAREFSITSLNYRGYGGKERERERDKRGEKGIGVPQFHSLIFF
jgi:hypothetical protein